MFQNHVKYLFSSHRIIFVDLLLTKCFRKMLMPKPRWKFMPIWCNNMPEHHNASIESFLLLEQKSCHTRDGILVFWQYCSTAGDHPLCKTISNKVFRPPHKDSWHPLVLKSYKGITLVIMWGTLTLSARHWWPLRRNVLDISCDTLCTPHQFALTRQPLSTSDSLGTRIEAVLLMLHIHI